MIAATRRRTPTLLGIAVDPSGRLVVVNANSGQQGYLMGIDPISGVRTTLSDALEFGHGIALEPSGQIVALSSGTAVLRADPRNGAWAIISQ